MKPVLDNPVLRPVDSDSVFRTTSDAVPNAVHPAPAPGFAAAPAEVADSGRIRMGAAFRLPTAR
jgi:hypothetical protein